MTVFISAKCSDLFFMQDLDTGDEYEGEVPVFFDTDTAEGGDYIKLEVDLETGQIQNWIAPTTSEISQYLGEEK